VSNAVIYRSALARELTPEVTVLFEWLLARATEIDALADTLPDQLLANRARREGNSPALTKSAKKAIRSFTKDSQKAASELPALVAALPTEALLVRTALECERTALSTDEALYSGGHHEDELLTRPLFELRSQTIAALEAFVSGPKSGGAHDRH
jgi:hypothetical protein